MTISDFIQRDLQARLDAGGEPPEKLTLAALAGHYQVSFTPVRAALGRLIARHYLRKAANGRLMVNPRRPAIRSGPPPPEPLPRDLYQTIARDAIRRSLRGEGDFLREEATAAKYGIGRTVIRQLFGRLAGQGLLEHEPRRGWRIRGFDESDMRAYLEVRETLELKALDLARPRLLRSDLQAMLAGNARAGPDARPRLDNQLHRYLVEKSDNFYIQDFFARHGVYYTTLFDHAALEASVVAEMARQHREILRSLISRDWPRARRALSAHIRAQQPIVSRLMRQWAAERNGQARRASKP